MKQLIINISYILSLLIGFTSCSKMIEDDYINPDKITTAEIDKLFTRMMLNDYIKPTYWDYATFVTGVTAKYSQFIGIMVGTDMYQPSGSYNQDRWKGFYTNGIMNQYRDMEKTYNNLSPISKAEKYVYLQVAKVVLYDQAAQLVDLWGDIPFTEAGMLNLTNTLINAKFDDASEIYYSIIDSLDALNTYFSTASISGPVQSSLSKQDILLNGNLTLWRKYANSLRLRLLMRTSYYNETIAQTEVTEMLNNPNTYPLVDNNLENILLQMNPGGEDLYSEGLRAGLTDRATSGGAIAPYYMLNEVMVANNDPRVEVLWDPGDSAIFYFGQEYLGLKHDTTVTAAQYMWSHDYLATYDSSTFILNWNVPGVLLAASEVSFLKAEAYERWSLGTAQDAYETGIRQSIEFYYDINQSAYLNPNYNYSRAPLNSPSEGSILAYLAEAGIAYSGTESERLQKIWTQKWLNFFILQAGQAWAEVRRTGYPQIPFASDPSNGDLPPMRLLYPDTEKSYNTANYDNVRSADTRDNEIFWDVD